MDSEDYQQLGASKKRRNAANDEKSTAEIIAWVIENVADVTAITDWQVRVSKGGKRVDIFTQSRKYNDINTNTRGVIKGSIADFLTKTLTIK